MINFRAVKLGNRKCNPVPYPAKAQVWSEGHVIESPRVNPYELPESEFQYARAKGLVKLHKYPVTTSAMIPYAPLKKLLESDFQNPFIKWINQVIMTGVSFNSVYADTVDLLAGCFDIGNFNT